MKKSVVRATTVAVLASFLMVGCYGPFSLTKKVHRWNGNIGDKWINSIMTWVLMIIPVYEFAGIADFLFLNVVEFWTGNNPVALQPGETQERVIARDGVAYRVKATQNRFDITQLTTGETVSLVYQPGQKTWSVVTAEKTYKIANVKDNNLIEVINPDNSTYLVNTATGLVMN